MLATLVKDWSTTFALGQKLMAAAEAAAGTDTDDLLLVAVLELVAGFRVLGSVDVDWGWTPPAAADDDGGEASTLDTGRL